MIHPPKETTLRTMMSLWLEQTDALAQRLIMSESGQPDFTVLLSQLRLSQRLVADLFARKAQYTPEKYAKLLEESKRS